jgi:hypothetical protein
VSDLSNQQVPQEEVFNADAYVRSLCENTKVVISDYLIIQFLPGWKNIMGDLIESIKGYPIQLTQITDSYSILDVKFNVLKHTREVNVWRAIERAREQSQLICAQCGNRKGSRRNNSTSTFCDSCIKNAGLLGKTGTWLDRY